MEREGVERLVHPGLDHVCQTYSLGDGTSLSRGLTLSLSNSNKEGKAGGCWVGSGQAVYVVEAVKK